jgi:hypothetical protein
MTAQPPYPGVSDDNLLACLKCPPSNAMPCVQITSKLSFIGSTSDTISKSL